MFNKTLIALSVASISSIIPLKAEDKGVYFFGSAGLGSINDIDYAANLGGGKAEFDYGFSPELGIGYDFGKIRTDFSYSLINSDTSKVRGVEINNDENKIKTFYLSAAYDFRADKKWQPYVGIGLGKSEVENTVTSEGAKIKVSKDGLTSVKVKLGVNYAASDNFDVFGEIYRATTEDISQTIEGVTYTLSDLSVNGVSLGLRYKI